jgi:F-type H+-transporting ATPase subunit delta
VIYTQSVVSKKYAQAFLNVYQDQLTLDQIQNFKIVIEFCRQHHNFLSIISQLVGRQKCFEALLDEMHEHFALPESIKKLIQILIKNKKISIFAQVLQDIYCLYMLRKNIVELTIKTAIPLDQEERKKIEHFFSKLSKKTIISNLEIDESLIAGIRLESDLFLWEHSIKSQLNSLQKNPIAYLSKKMVNEQ